jgi:hypothetical protein
MLIALIGNDKGDLAGLKNRREFGGRAEKHGGIDGPPLDMKVVTRKCDRGHKRLPGINRQMRSESCSASIPVLAWLPERVTSIT